MADVTVKLDWQHEGLVFQGGAVGGIPTTVDGKSRTAVSPVQALLVSLVGCTASDIVDILGKMRVSFKELRVTAEGDRAPSAPRRFTAIRLIYEVEGLDNDCDVKLRRAVELSHEKYCSVLHSLREDINVTTDVVIR